ncbi:hypothetical protein DL546_005442 [Coniochaeta pulveracea]|uniref:Uncharacterized protein n=1 Tax=Coniochaeta pulveracea TaxID=177199 RepID=A0A420YBM0_9PEZI|nr:hypothetical protein DL546_005442 [Coniochaeta pulveracea]
MPAKQGRASITHAQVGSVCSENDDKEHTFRRVFMPGVQCTTFTRCRYDTSKKKKRIWWCQDCRDCYFCRECKERVDRAWERLERAVAAVHPETEAAASDDEPMDSQDATSDEGQMESRVSEKIRNRESASKLVHDVQVALRDDASLRTYRFE